MDNDYFLVTWVKENPVRYSVMARADLVETKDRLMLAEDIISQELLFKWGKKTCVGKILSSGQKSDLESEMLQIIEDAKLKSKMIRVIREPKAKRASNPNALTIAKKSKIDATLIDTEPQDPRDAKIIRLETELKLEKEARMELERKCKKQADQLLEYMKTPGTSVDIGNGILLPRDFLTTIRSVSASMNVYARNLFKHLFKPHDVIGYSLMGKKCNANKTEKHPSIDPTRRDAIIEHSLEAYGKAVGSDAYNYGKKDLKKSLQCLMLEMARESKQLEDRVIEMVQNDGDAVI